jgi:hypothetical protein
VELTRSLGHQARTKIQGRVNRVGVAHHLLSLLSGYSPIDQSKTDDEATRLVTGFLEAVWNLPPPAEPVKRIEYVTRNTAHARTHMHTHTVCLLIECALRLF